MRSTFLTEAEGCVGSASFNSKNMCQATFATLGSVKKLEKNLQNGASLLIMDECHLHSNPEGGMLNNF